MADLPIPPLPSSAPPAMERVNLRGKVINPSALHRIPQTTAERYQVVCFEETPTSLKLAIVYPEQLKQGFFTAIKDLGAKLGRSIELFQTDAASLRIAIGQYVAAPAVVVPDPDIHLTTSIHPPYPKPPLFELGASVAFSYLRRVPIDFARTHRVMCVDFVSPNTFWFVIDRKAGDAAIRILQQIEERNHMQIVPLPIATLEFDDLLGYYEAREKERQDAILKQVTEGKEQKKVEAPDGDGRVTVGPQHISGGSEGENELSGEEQVLAADVLEPAAQAAILTSEEERGGIAGLFQKMNQTSVAGKAAPVATLEAAKVEIAATEKQAQKDADAKIIKAGGTPASAAPAEAPAATPAAPVDPAKPGEMAITQITKPTGAPKPEEDADGDFAKILPKPVESHEELKAIVQKGFIPRLVAAILSFAIHEKASDIHIEAFDDEVRVRFRIDGQLIDIVKMAPDVHAAMVSRIKILSRMRLDESRVPQDGRFDVEFDHARVDLRVSVMPTVHGEKVVMRLLDKDKSIVSLDSLGVQGLAFRNLIDSVTKPFGICLATGPTGSGKSTTLYAILNRIATPNVNVITLEDPVEFEMKGINQVQVRPRIGFTFAEGLRAVLRQDPNVIMVGEIRDGETANMATQSALTGHLVLSSLHTNDAAGAIPRLSNMGIEPFLITSSLNCALGQRLVRRVCPKCKQEMMLPPSIKDKLAKDLAIIKAANPLDAKRVPDDWHVYQGTGCAECGGTGYKGRLGIYEVLSMNEEIEDLTLKHAPGSQIQEAATKAGMLSMYQDGLLKVVSGITTLDEVLRESTSK